MLRVPGYMARGVLLIARSRWCFNGRSCAPVTRLSERPLGSGIRGGSNLLVCLRQPLQHRLSGGARSFHELCLLLLTHRFALLLRHQTRVKKHNMSINCEA